jgi:hypothetical protein
MTVENILSLAFSSIMTMCTISSNSREFDSAAMEAPPAEIYLRSKTRPRLPICHLL